MFVWGVNSCQRLSLHLALLRAIILTATRCEYRGSSKYLSFGSHIILLLLIYESVKGGAICGPASSPHVHLASLIPPPQRPHTERRLQTHHRESHIPPLRFSSRANCYTNPSAHPSSHPPFIDRNQTASTAETAVDPSGTYSHQIYISI